MRLQEPVQVHAGDEPSWLGEGTGQRQAAADAAAAELRISRRQVYVLRTGQRYPVSMTDQYKLLIKGLAGGMTIAATREWLDQPTRGATS